LGSTRVGEGAGDGAIDRSRLLGDGARDRYLSLFSSSRLIYGGYGGCP
jgi:hypothetical protein